MPVSVGAQRLHESLPLGRGLGRVAVEPDRPLEDAVDAAAREGGRLLTPPGGTPKDKDSRLLGVPVLCPEKALQPVEEAEPQPRGRDAQQEEEREVLCR